jgi:SAM-dependent methyltransferase
MPTQWIEDWFGSDYYCQLYKRRSPEEAVQFIDKLTAFLRLAPGARVLDCGCGRGRHSIHLSEKGFDVTGIDLSEKSIKEAKKSERDNLVFYVHDKRNIFRINYYDAAFSLFTSFGYFESDSENNKSIRSMTKALKPGGWFVLDFMNSVKEVARLIAEEKNECDGIAFSLKRYIKDRLIVKEIHVSDKGKVSSYREHVKAYQQADLENFFNQNQLDVVHLFGDYALNKFDPSTSERLILIGKKK